MKYLYVKSTQFRFNVYQHSTSNDSSVEEINTFKLHWVDAWEFQQTGGKF